MLLCHSCQDFFDNISNGRWYIDWAKKYPLYRQPAHEFHVSIDYPRDVTSNWFTSAEAGCEACALLADSCGIAEQRTRQSTECTMTWNGARKRFEAIEWRSTAGRFLLHCNVFTHSTTWFVISMSRLEHVLCSMRLQVTDAFPQALIGNSQLLDVGEKQIPWKLMSAWLNVCRTRHPSCRKVEDRDQFVPNLLVDVGAQTKPLDVRLVHLTDTDLKPEHYLTLSHRWGFDRFSKLTTLNYVEFLEHIPSHELPPLFRDAFEVTRRLGFRYLWIDSLCIKQDSQEDWQEQSACMGSIYQNAICNIAVTDCTDDGQGFLARKEPSSNFPVPTFKVDCTFSDGVHHQGQYLWFDDSSWHSSFDLNPLNMRGWVTQERLLSSRILHFGPESVFWECSECIASESFPGGLHLQDVSEKSGPSFGLDGHNGSSLALKNWKAETLRNLISHKTDSNTTHNPTMYSTWARIVDTYSGCALTFEHDKLVALSGLAREMQRLLKDQYLAGLWRKNLVNDLCWQVESAGESGDVPSRPLKYRAPSWSWASVVARIRLGTNTAATFQPLAFVEDATVALVSADEFGQVNGGVVTIRGILRTPICAYPSERDERVDERWTLNGHFMRCFFDLESDADDRRPAFVCLVLILHDWAISGLLLSETARSHEYERVGTFVGVDDDSPRESFLRMLELRQDRFDDLDDYENTYHPLKAQRVIQELRDEMVICNII